MDKGLMQYGNYMTYLLLDALILSVGELVHGPQTFHVALFWASCGEIGHPIPPDVLCVLPHVEELGDRGPVLVSPKKAQHVCLEPTLNQRRRKLFSKSK